MNTEVRHPVCATVPLGFECSATWPAHTSHFYDIIVLHLLIILDGVDALRMCSSRNAGKLVPLIYLF